jgi:hypothetical protein
VRHIGIVVDTPDSYSIGIGFAARSEPLNDAELHSARSILTFAPSNQAVHPSEVEKLVPVSAGVNVLLCTSGNGESQAGLAALGI